MRKCFDLIDRTLPFGLCLYVFVLSIIPINDPDFWWHLKNGEHLLATRRLGGPDVFAYTSTSTHFVQHYWLFDILLFLAYRAVGFRGLTLLQAATLTATFWIAYRLAEYSTGGLRQQLATSRDGVVDRTPHRAMNVLLVALAAATSRARFFPRPELASFLLFVLELRLLATRHDRSPLAPLWLLPLQLLWANLHGSFILGLLVPWVYVLPDARYAVLRQTEPNAEFREKRARWAILTGSAALLAPVSLLNPSGYRLMLLPFETLTMPQLHRIGEWRSTIEMVRLGEFVTYSDSWILLALLGIGLVAAAFLVRPFDLEGCMLAALLILLLLKHVRMIPYFALFAPSFIAGTAAAISSRTPQLRSQGAKALGWIAPVTVWLVLIMLGVQRVGRDTRFPFSLGINEWGVPSQAAQFIEEVRLQGRMLNSYDLGGYLIWRLGPGQKVFIDGRYGPFPPSLLDDYLGAFKSADQFQSVVNKYGVAYVILSFSSFNSCLRFEQLGLGKTWALVFWDDTACIYLARTKEHQRLIEAHEYRHTRYGLEDPYLSTSEHDPAQAAMAIGELQRAIDSSPFHERALQGQAYLYFATGDGSYNSALSKLDEILRLNPGSAWAHLVRALILMNRDDDSAARREAQAAVQLDPADPTAHAVLAKLYARLGDREAAQRSWETYQQRLRARARAAEEMTGQSR